MYRTLRYRIREGMLLLLFAVVLWVWQTDIATECFLVSIMAILVYGFDVRVLGGLALLMLLLSPLLALLGRTFFAERTAQYTYGFLLAACLIAWIQRRFFPSSEHYS